MEATRLHAWTVEQRHLRPQQTSDALTGAEDRQLRIIAKGKKLLRIEHTTANNVALCTTCIPVATSARPVKNHELEAFAWEVVMNLLLVVPHGVPGSTTCYLRLESRPGTPRDLTGTAEVASGSSVGEAHTSGTHQSDAEPVWFTAPNL